MAKKTTEVGARDLPLKWEVFVTPGIPIATSDLPPEHETADVAADIVDSHLRQAGCRPRRSGSLRSTPSSRSTHAL
jgi:hypothetical protein